MNKDEVFLKQLMETFKIEADEHLKRAALIFIALEKSDHPFEKTEDIETVFREIHSLKGAARAVNLKRVESVCQVMESVMSQLKKQALKFTPEVFDAFQDSLDYLARTIDTVDKDSLFEDKNIEKSLFMQFEQLKKQVTVSTTHSILIEKPLETLAEVANSQIDVPVTNQIKAFRGSELFGIETTSTQRVSSARLSSVLLQSEEMLTLKLASHEQTQKSKAMVSTFVEWKKKHNQFLPIERVLRNTLLKNNQDPTHTDYKNLIDQSKSLLEFMDWSNQFVKHSEASLIEISKISKYNDFTLRSMIDSLQEEMKKIAMTPFSTILDLIPKMVRDISNQNGQKINVQITGGEIEIDRRILEEMHDPIIHLMRNCIDHGIEKPEERKQKNKTEVGEIQIDIIPRDQMVEFIVRDDGRGVSVEAIREALKGDVAQSKMHIDQFTTEEMKSAVFLSGISTSPIITEMSGRGLGLAIVKEKVEKLGGNIEMQSEKDIGTCFQILLPLTIATFRGILISAGNQKFIIPTRYVERVKRLKKEDLRTIENREIIYVNDKSISLVKLTEVLGLKSAKIIPSDYIQVIIIAFESSWIAFQVDEVLNEQEVLFKNLGPLLIKVKNVIGATVLGSGEVVPILNVIDLLDTSISGSAVEHHTEDQPIRAGDSQTASRVLIAEDSITTRTFLKNILESSGYSVETAIDGLDALTKLKTTDFDLVLSDVDMPRMNGFELTSKIRNRSDTKNLPVILITALASQEDQERGIDVGANAYIIKESFDQRNLLDVMKRLIPREDAS